MCDCGLTYDPPTLFCERCFATLDKFVEIPKWGKLVTYAVNYEDLEGNKLGEPQVVAMVHIDGAHGELKHTLRGAEPQDIRIGKPVEIVFVPEKDRIGSILDISHFRPVRTS